MSKKNLYDIFDAASAKDIDTILGEDVFHDSLSASSINRIKDKTISKAIKRKSYATWRRKALPAIAACLVICIGVGVLFSTGLIAKWGGFDVPTGEGMITRDPSKTVTEAPPSTDVPTSSDTVGLTTIPEPGIVIPRGLVVREKSNIFLMNMRIEEGTGYAETYSTLTPGTDDSIEASLQYNEQLKKYGCYFRVGLKTRTQGTLKVVFEGENGDIYTTVFRMWVKEPGSETYTQCGSSYEAKNYGNKKYESEPVFFVSDIETPISSATRAGVVKIIFTDNESGQITEAACFKYSFSAFVVDSEYEIIATESCTVSLIRAASFPSTEGQLVTDEYLNLFFADPSEYASPSNATRMLKQSEYDDASVYLKEGMYLYEAVSMLGTSKLERNANVATLKYNCENGKGIQVYADENYVITKIEFRAIFPPEGEDEIPADTSANVTADTSEVIADTSAAVTADIVTEPLFT